MKKIKILQFPIANSYGGITHYALNNWKWMDKDKFQCDFATMSKKLDFADEILATGSKIHYISCYAEENEEQFIKEIDKILDENYDVVHLHTKQWKSFLVEKICLERNVPKVIVHSHSTKCDANNPKKREWETREHYRVREEFNENMATDFWACSEEAAEWLFGDRISRDKICIMNNAIETDKFLYNETVRKELREEYALEDKFVIGNVGRLEYPKNQKFLIDVFSEIYTKRKDIVLVLVGEGALREQLKKQVQQLGLEQAVLFLGKREDVENIYQMMDLFVLPSNFEGLPITLVEAQTAGLQCICSMGISVSANMTGNVTYLPLEKQQWVKVIESRILFYTRENMSQIMKESGYNLETQVQYLQEKYQEHL